MHAFLMVLFLIFSFIAFAQTEAVSIKYRSAQEIEKSLQNLIGNKLKLSVFQNQLLLEGSPSDIADIKKLITTIDTPVKQYRITVTNHQNADGNVDTYGTYSDDDLTKSVVVSDGEWGSIDLGSKTPVGEIFTTSQNQLQGGIQYESLPNSIYVRPNTLENSVRLEFSTQQDTLDHHVKTDSIQTQALKTTMNVPLNTWVEVGGQSQANDDTHAEVYTTHNNNEHHFYLKVEGL